MALEGRFDDILLSFGEDAVKKAETYVRFICVTPTLSLSLSLSLTVTLTGIILYRLLKVGAKLSKLKQQRDAGEDSDVSEFMEFALVKWTGDINVSKIKY